MNKFDLLVAKLIALDKIDANRICLSDLDFSFNDESEYFEFLNYLEGKNYIIVPVFFDKDNDDGASKLTSNITLQYLDEIGSFSLFSYEEEKYYFDLYSKSKSIELRNFIACHNLKLVVYIAKEFNANGLDFIDLVQEGNEGLLVAIERFDYSKGVKFSTYAYYWIKSFISKSIANKSRVIRLPYKLHENVTKVYKVKEKLLSDLGYEPSYSEIALMAGFTEEEVIKFFTCEKFLVSIDSAVKGFDSEDPLGEFIEDYEASIPFREVLDDLIISQFWDIAREILTEKEYSVFSLRFDRGLNILAKQKDVASYLGTSRASVNQLEIRAKSKLRRDVRVKSLIPFK